ncbi:MAG: Nicotinamide-nucleotide amidohydrolase PncC [Daejeonella sp.]|nr:Nicotinamide-nucleotide amidohydrolase PncC [Daejeonella sp.]
MPSSIVLECSKALADSKLRIAFAESASAGRLAAEFSLAPESGQVLLGGIVCYDASIKTNILGVPQALIDKHTPESEEVTKSLASCFKKFMPADIVVAITGLTTSGGSESAEKPVGTIFAEGLFKERPFGFRKVFTGSADKIVLAAIDAIAESVLEALAVKEV